MLSTSTIRSIQRYRSINRIFAAALLVLVLAGTGRPAAAAEELAQLFVTEPYLELHQGPGRGYAVTQVVPRGDSVDVLYRRTEWFRVRTPRGVEGWAHQRDMMKTTWADGTPFKVDLGDRAGFTSHRWELGAFAGDYGGATLISSYLSRSFNEQLAIELTASQFLGNASNGYALDVGLTHVFRPEWRLSPFVTLGTGVIYIEPKSTLVVPEDRTDQTAYVGAGVRFYLTRRFFARAEYRSHMVFTSRNQNEEIDEWKLGLAFFF
ncbi:MAG: SH3 domain-containing protein [Steroidobacteraceae bacterium]